MASADNIAQVRLNVDEESQDTFSDDYISALVDAGSVDSASATIWEAKAAAWSDLADVNEGGSSLKMSGLHKNALAMARRFRDNHDTATTVAATVTSPRTRAIERP